MKIAIASLGKDKSAEVSSVAGRSPYYLIFENEELIEVVKNPFMVGGGAGFGVAKLLADKGVEKVASGKFGGNMIGALKEKGIDGLETTGIVEDVLKTILEM